mmetsp:Transcript_36932/g.92793  ORF Transcript_36932/g.92793 Transcript_36932/m.92793 type:complete len:399 (-) Transcript_36932:484-1680(-)
MGIGSKNASATPMVTAVGILLLVLTFLPFVYTLPYAVNMILQASSVVYIGAHLSIPGTQINVETGEEEEKPALETMSRRDVMKFPIMGSCVLFGLYVIFKLYKDLANMLLGLYFTGLGVLALAGLVAPFLQPFLPKTKKLTTLWDFEVPLLGQVQFNGVDVLSTILCSGVGYIYYTTHHWCTNNLFGVSFGIRGIELLSLGSYVNGGDIPDSALCVSGLCCCPATSQPLSPPFFMSSAILLAGLFIYDIFWVFGTDVMVTVAKSFQAPIKLVFPRDWSAPVGQQFSMLGLGDIVIPGLFIALLLRWDVNRQKAAGKHVSESCKVYFYAQFIAYILGLVTTVVFMTWYKTAQPALLYLVPAALGSSLVTALFKGEINELITMKEEEGEEAKDPKAVKKD